MQVAGAIGQEGGSASRFGPDQEVSENREPARAGVGREQGRQADRPGEGLSAGAQGHERALDGLDRGAHVVAPDRRPLRGLDALQRMIGERAHRRRGLDATRGSPRAALRAFARHGRDGPAR